MLTFHFSFCSKNFQATQQIHNSSNHKCFNYFDNFVRQLAGYQIGNFMLAFDCTLITMMRNPAGGKGKEERVGREKERKKLIK